MFKKFLVFFSVIILSASLSACGKKDDNTASIPNAPVYPKQAILSFKNTKGTNYSWTYTSSNPGVLSISPTDRTTITDNGPVLSGSDALTTQNFLISANIGGATTVTFSLLKAGSKKAVATKQYGIVSTPAPDLGLIVNEY